MEDYLLRRFARQTGRFSRQAKGSGKSGVLAVTAPGQEVLERTDCQVRAGTVTLRFEVGFPANGRTINAPELDKILFEFLPTCVEQGLLYVSVPKGELERVMALAEDRHFIREELERLDLAAFVADGSVLPRESGVSDRPMQDAVTFQSPESMAVTLELPHRGAVRGMGVRRGITLIAGGGYHGKSTLLKALERGVYDHIADRVVQMDSYHTRDITEQAKAALAGRPVPALAAPGFHLPVGKRMVDLSGNSQTRKNYRGDGYRQERLKVKCFSKTAFSVGDRELDLRHVEQLVDAGQTRALGYMARYAREHLAGRTMEDVVAALVKLIGEKGLGAVCGGGIVPAGLTKPRVQEIFVCFDRY